MAAFRQVSRLFVCAQTVLVIICVLGTQVRKVEGGKRPNIIVIQPDDFPWINGQWPEAPTPRIAELSFANRSLDLQHINRQETSSHQTAARVPASIYTYATSLVWVFLHSFVHGFVLRLSHDLKVRHVRDSDDPK